MHISYVSIRISSQVYIYFYLYIYRCIYIKYVCKGAIRAWVWVGVVGGHPAFRLLRGLEDSGLGLRDSGSKHRVSEGGSSVGALGIRIGLLGSFMV